MKIIILTILVSLTGYSNYKAVKRIRKMSTRKKAIKISHEREIRESKIRNFKRYNIQLNK